MFGKRSLLIGKCHMQSNQSAVNCGHLPETELSAGPRPRSPERGVQTIYWRGCDEKVIQLQWLIQARIPEYSTTFQYARFQASMFLYNPKPPYSLQTPIPTSRCLVPRWKDWTRKASQRMCLPVKSRIFLSVYSAHFLTDVYDPSLLCEYLHFQEAQNRTLSCVRAV